MSDLAISTHSPGKDEDHSADEADANAGAIVVASAGTIVARQNQENIAPRTLATSALNCFQDRPLPVAHLRVSNETVTAPEADAATVNRFDQARKDVAELKSANGKLQAGTASAHKAYSESDVFELMEAAVTILEAAKTAQGPAQRLLSAAADAANYTKKMTGWESSDSDQKNYAQRTLGWLERFCAFYAGHERHEQTSFEFEGKDHLKLFSNALKPSALGCESAEIDKVIVEKIKTKHDKDGQDVLLYIMKDGSRLIPINQPKDSDVPNQLIRILPGFNADEDFLSFFQTDDAVLEATAYAELIKTKGSNGENAHLVAMNEAA